MLREAEPCRNDLAETDQSTISPVAQVCLANILMATLLCSPLMAQSQTVVLHRCPEDIIRETVELPPIPIGCEFPECCEICNPDMEVTWRMTISGNGIKRVEIQPGSGFEAGFRAKQRSGPVRRRRGGFVVRPGTSEAGEFVGVDVHASGIAMASVAFNPKGLQPNVESTFLLEQLFGSTVVNAFQLKVTPKSCFSEAPFFNKTGTHDRLTLVHHEDDTGAIDEARVHMSYRDEGTGFTGALPSPSCRSERFETVSNVDFGNVLSKGPCDGVLTVLSNGDSLWYEPSLNDWTYKRGELVKRSLEEPVEVPVDLWVKQTGFPADVASTWTDALFDYNHVGVTLKWRVCDLTANSCEQTPILAGEAEAATALIDAVDCGGAETASLAALKASKWYTDGRLNVYARGDDTNVYCRSDDPNTILVGHIGGSAYPSRLAHEIAHAFGLRSHANDTACLIGTRNIMAEGGGGGPMFYLRNFSDGQAFHMNVHHDSRLNHNLQPGTALKLRDGPTENCDYGNQCLSLCGEVIQHEW